MTAISAASVNVRTMADADLFMRLLKRMASTPSGCLEFQGCRSKAGYGGIQILGEKVGTHRAMWMAVHGPIPDGMCVLHRCDNPSCINPDHLFLGTFLDNNIDRKLKGRSFRPRGELNPMAIVSDDQRDEAIRRYASGGRAEEIAQDFGVSRSAVCLWARNAGVRSPGTKSGERNGRAVLTREKVAKAKDWLVDGISKSEIGRRLGVSDTAIGRIANGKGWI